MLVGTFIVTEVVGGEPGEVHFACAGSPDKARSLVARRARVPEERLSVVLLRWDEGDVPRTSPPRRRVERYLGPLAQFSPFLREPCRFCGGSGRITGNRASETCGVCGGSGLRASGRA